MANINAHKLSYTLIDSSLALFIGNVARGERNKILKTVYDLLSETSEIKRTGISSKSGAFTETQLSYHAKRFDRIMNMAFSRFQ